MLDILIHSGEPQSLAEAWQTWTFEPSVIIGVALFIAVYLLFSGPLRSRFQGSTPVSTGKKAWFMVGALVFMLALISPLDAVGDSFLFSAHMTQHALLTLVAAPFLLIGTPGWMLRPLLLNPRYEKFFRILTHPIFTFFLFNAVFIGWHYPALYEAALENEGIHVLQHLMFIATGVLNWWPVLSPIDEINHLPGIGRLVYLFLDGLPTTILSAIVVFAPNVLYPTYAKAAITYGINAAMDQQIAGLIMWMPGGMIYLLALTLVFFQWQKQEEEKGKQIPATDQTSSK